MNTKHLLTIFFLSAISFTAAAQRGSGNGGGGGAGGGGFAGRTGGTAAPATVVPTTGTATS